ncbi:MAG: glycosyltransferase [Planctomycetaceae bacterium]
MSAVSPVRVLHVTEASNAGVGGHIVDLIENQASYECKVHFLYSPIRVDQFFQARVRNIPSDVFTLVPMKRMPHWTDFTAASAIQKCIADRGPFDIIHAHSTKAGGLCRVGKIRKAAKIVYTPNGMFSLNPTSNLVSRGIVTQAERYLAGHSHAIIAVSPEEQQHMTSIGISADRIRMIPNGLRPIQWDTRDRIREELGISRKSLVFGFLGRLASQKNPAVLIKAFAGLADLPAAQLAIVGVGSMEIECRRLAQELGIADRIYWLGYKTAQQAMPAFDVFVMPSRYEGMPYVIMEALSLGLPVIATPVGGTSLTVNHGVNGFVVPVDGVAETSRAMRTLVDDSVRNKMSDASLKKAKEFSVDLMVRRTVEVYREILDG